MHKKKLMKFLAIFVIIILCVSVFFLTHENELSLSSTLIIEEKPVESKLKPYSLTLDDLPEGYEIEEDHNYGDEEENFYWIRFSYTGNETEKYAYISLSFTEDISNSSTIEDDEIKKWREYVDFVFYNATEIKREIGDDSYIVIHNTSDSLKDSFVPMIITSIFFRISNICCYLSWQQDNNFDYLFDLAKIVEQRMYDSIT